MLTQKRKKREHVDEDENSRDEDGILDLASPKDDLDETKSKITKPLDTLAKKRKLKSAKRSLNNQDRLARQEEDLSLHQRQATATSLDGLLRQALMSGDRKLLDTVIRNIDLLVVRRTVSQLPPELIEEFLQQLVDRIQTTSLRMREAGPWIREILRQHTGFCSSVQGVKDILKKIYYHAGTRLRYHSSLIKLQSELDGISYTGIRRLEETAQLEKNPFASTEPLLKYKEGTEMAHKLDVLIPTKSRSYRSADIEDDEIIETTDTEGDCFDECIQDTKDS